MKDLLRGLFCTTTLPAGIAVGYMAKAPCVSLPLRIYITLCILLLVLVFALYLREDDKEENRK